MKLGSAAIVLMGLLCLSVPARAGPDEAAVEQTILAEAKSPELYAETRDKHAILKLYTTDYSGIQDGESETRETIEKWLSDYGVELDKGSTLRFLGAVSNLAVHITGPVALATYDYVFQALRNGELEAQDRGKCTSLLRKEASGWLIFHEHCSKTKVSGGER